MPIPEGEAIVLATAKPGRSSWALEEVLDTLYPLDPELALSETRFEGVILARLKAGRDEVSSRLRRTTFAFVSFVMQAEVVCRGPTRDELASAVLEVARRLGGPVALRLKARGTGKRIAERRWLEEYLKERGVVLSRKSAMLVAVESVDEEFMLAGGTTRPCGESCTLLDVATSKPI